MDYKLGKFTTYVECGDDVCDGHRVVKAFKVSNIEDGTDVHMSVDVALEMAEILKSSVYKRDNGRLLVRANLGE